MTEKVRGTSFQPDECAALAASKQRFRLDKELGGQ